MEFVTVLLHILISFGYKPWGILASWPGIEPKPPALDVEVLTTGPPSKSHYFASLT